MQNDQKYIQSFYHEQCLQIRKQIRQMDMQFRQTEDKNNSKKQSNNQQYYSKLQINFLVLGPHNSGKSSLLKTMNFALNSNANMEVSTSELPSTLIKRFDIKKSKQYNIEGLAAMKETDKKMTITGLQFEPKYSIYVNQRQLTPQQRTNRIFQRYTNALQIVSNKTYGCFSVQTSKKSKQSYRQSYTNIKIVLIVLSIVQKIQHDEMSCIKFFLSDIKEKGIKAILVLTHIDKLSKLQQKQKLELLESRIIMLIKQLDIKDRDDVFCMENYKQSNWQKITQQSNQLKAIQSNPSNKILQNGVQNKPQSNYSYNKKINQQQNNVFRNQRVKLLNNINGSLEKSQIQIIKQQKIENSFTIRIPANQSLKSSQISQMSGGSQIGKNNLSNQINLSFKNYQVNQNHYSSLNNKTNNNSNNKASINSQNNRTVNNCRQNTDLSSKQIFDINYEQFSLSNSNIIQVSTLNDKRIFDKLQNNFTQVSFSTQSFSSQKQLKPITVSHQDYQTMLYKQKNKPKSKFIQEQINQQGYHCLVNTHEQNQNKKAQDNNKQLSKIINNDQINYYSLKLLLKVIKQNQKYNKQIKNRKLKWFCG